MGQNGKIDLMEVREGVEPSLKQRELNSIRKEKFIDVLTSTAAKIKSLTVMEEGINPEEAEFRIDKLHLDIESVRPQSGSFSFWGGLVGKLSFPELQTMQDYVPVIKNLRLPQTARGAGLGSSIVKVWEDAMVTNGFKTLAVTNVSGPEAVLFWKKHGYSMREGEIKKEAPYYMYKTLA